MAHGSRTLEKGPYGKSGLHRGENRGSEFRFTLGLRTVVAPPSSVVKCLWEVFIWGFGVLLLSCVCVSVSGVLFSLCVCVCV